MSRSTALLAVGLIASLALGPAQASPSDCSPAGNTKFVCGVLNAEDLVPLQGTHWVIAGGVSGPGVTSGHLFLMDSDDRTAAVLYPRAHNDYRQDQRRFGACPGAPDESKFVAHGINVRPTGYRRYRLYAINHGGRESVEIFEVDARGDTPAIVWTGCVLIPPDRRSKQPWVANSVAPLADGAFAVTVNPTVDTSNPKDPAEVSNGRVEGRVMIWDARGGWRDVPGSELLFNNGIEASRDGKWLYVAASGEPGVYRLSLDRSPVQRVVVKTDFHPDNLRWGDDGYLYATGPTGPLDEVISCAVGSAFCASPFKVLRIDPHTLQSEELLNEPGGAMFGLATGVAKVGREIWLGSPRGTRIAVFPLR